MGVFDKIEIKQAPFIPAFNTGGLYDLATGSFVPGNNGSFVLNGGVSNPSNGVTGRPQLFKSTMALSHCINVFARIPQAELLIYDTEKTLNKSRILAMSDIDVSHREHQVKLTTRGEYDLDEFYDNILKPILYERIKNKKDYLVEIPYIDPKTKKFKVVMSPFIVCIDSWSNAKIKEISEILSSDKNDKSSISGSTTNTVFMKDGLAKKKIIAELNRLAEKAGVYVYYTSHIGDKIDLNAYTPTPKSLQYMKMSDKPKGVGSDFLFLIMNLLDCRSAKSLQDSDKKNMLYPSKKHKIQKDDLNEVTAVLTRCKNNASGQTLTSLISQHRGILNPLSHYHYIKTNGYFGLDGSPVSHSLCLYPDVKLSRTTIYDLCDEDDNLRRCLEITSFLCYVQSNWSLTHENKKLDVNIKDFSEKLLKNKQQYERILKSRGWYTTREKDNPFNEIEYLSLIDIINIYEKT